ncbi:Gfo/Idh/MocA family oxidoreductase [Cellulomonas sp. NPDC089187]|uniref:Gfo/Idh/MocA family protein n=1 Tax=Cellulomonas sp. NPDC089187 TaxID=3154970 RepID=UPI0034163E4E
MTLIAEPRTAPALRWGILGAGNIAGHFTDALHAETESRAVAVGSRNRDKAARWAAAHGVPTVHGSYAELVADPQVDVVYVATPHSEHREHALLAIAAGKHVLVEKAFTRNAAEAREVLDAAKAAGVFVMEAMWTRFLPHVQALHQILDSGEIGEVVALFADHGQFFPLDPSSRLYDPALAGGALLDLGVYPVSFAHDLLGAPRSVHATGQLTTTGVDGQIGVVLDYGERTQATLSTTLWARTPTTAAITGTDGAITVEGSFYAPTSFTVQRRDGRVWTFDRPTPHGLQFEAAEVARRITEGATQSPRMTWQHTLDVMTTMDTIREQIGVRYPGE